MSKNRSIYLRKAQRNAPPTERGEGLGGGPTWVLLALAVLIAIGVNLVLFQSP